MLSEGLSLRTGYLLRTVFALVFLILICFGSAPAVEAQTPQDVEIAIAVSLTGSGDTYGRPALDGAQLAVEEANAAGAGPTIKLTVYDDHSDAEQAQEVARQIIAGDALVVVGPATTAMALASGPLYAEAGLVCIGTTATGDSVTDNATTFRASFSTSDGGEAIANYLGHALGGRRAVVFFKDDGFGRPFSAGFKRAAERLKITTTYHSFATAEEAEKAARLVAKGPDQPAIVIGTLVADVVPIVKTLRREGAQGIILGTNTIAGDFFPDFFSNEPEEDQTPGYFTNGVYAAAPLFFDSANAETLAFADRFRARFNQEPSYISAQGYEAARLAIAAVRAADQNPTASDLQTRRQAVYTHLASLDGPVQSVKGLNGPLWFTPERGRQQPLRVGRFYGRLFESAPIQLTPVLTPDPDEITSGAVFEIGPDRYARLQRVVYTGVYLNEIPRVDLTRSSFNADFYLWLRFAGDAGPDNPTPTDLIFPSLVSGNFNREHPMKERKLADGTEYWLWRVQGEFRNDFDLHRFPFDNQNLSLSFFNARASIDQLVYVVDKRATTGEPASSPPAQPGDVQAAQLASSETLSIASPAAFRNLTQWDPLGAQARRENLVTDFALGDPASAGLESRLELSGFLVTVELERRALATLTKSLLPLLLLTLVMYASLYFPVALVKEKVTVAVTAALSGAVLLTAINSQLGGVGYTIAVEYVFYVFFGLSLLCIIAVLSAERLRAGNQNNTAILVDNWTRIVFLLAVAGTLAGTLWLYWSQ